MTLTAGKTKAMKNLMSEDGIIAALAIDQRGALKKMMKALDFEPKAGDIERFKELVSEELTPYASSILLIQNMVYQQVKYVLKIADYLLLMKKPGMMQQFLDVYQIYYLFGQRNVSKNKDPMPLNSCFTMM